MRRAPALPLALALLAATLPFATAGGGNATADGEAPGPGSPYLARNETWSSTFAEAGETTYHCHPHPGMTGKVVVRDGAPATANVTIENLAFAPAEIVVAPGGTVTWTNLDAAEHTVTFDGEGGHGAHAGHEAAGPGAVAALLALAGIALALRRRG